MKKFMKALLVILALATVGGAVYFFIQKKNA